MSSRRGLKDLATSPPPLPPRHFKSVNNNNSKRGDSISSGSSGGSGNSTNSFGTSTRRKPPALPPRINILSSPPISGQRNGNDLDDDNTSLEFTLAPSYSDISSNSPITFRKPKKPVIDDGDDKAFINKYKGSSYVKRKLKPAPLNLTTLSHGDSSKDEQTRRQYHQRQQSLTDDKPKGNENRNNNNNNNNGAGAKLSPSIARDIKNEMFSPSKSSVATSPTLSDPSSLPRGSSSRTGSYTQLSSYFGFASTSQERLFLSDDHADVPKSPGNGASNTAQFLIMYPSYARRVSDQHGGCYEVDVRGWIYMPGVMGRKNRVILGMAKQFLVSRVSNSTPSSARTSISLSEYDQPGDSGGSTASYRSILSNPISAASSISKDDVKRWSSSIWSGARAKASALKGKRSNTPGNQNNDDSPISSYKVRDSASRSTSSLNLIDLDENDDDINTEDLVIKAQSLESANLRIKSRIAPFLAQPVVRKNVNIQAESEDGTIDDNFDTLTAASGRFELRIQLDYPPARVHINGGSENLFAVQQVDYVDYYGVSVISDIDDTVKHTGILGDRKTVFRNVFSKEFSEVEIPGVREWYKQMQKMGVYFHYVSNAPWQLYPALKDFLKSAGLPEGSMHLKHYSGLWAGVLEPVLERKKASLDGILKDFPGRKFILIGDSGEMDLEIYSIIAQRYPGQILAIYIRDITTPTNQPLEQPDTIMRKCRYRYDKGTTSQDTVAYPVTPVGMAEKRPDLSPSHHRTATNNGKYHHSPEADGSSLKPVVSLADKKASTNTPPPIARKPQNLRSSPISFEDKATPGSSAIAELLLNSDKAKSTTDLERGDDDNNECTVKFADAEHDRSDQQQQWSKGHKVNRSESTIYEQSSAALSDSNLATEYPLKSEHGKRLEEWRRRVIRAKRDLPPDVEFKLWRSGEGDIVQDSRKTLSRALDKVPPFSR